MVKGQTEFKKSRSALGFPGYRETDAVPLKPP